jgi:Tfp pilus assembly protein PilX
MRKRNSRNPGNKESGIALLIVLMALFLIAAVGMGMIFMANTETSINQNYRDTQTAFFAMRGGLEEMRDRMRSNAPSAITLPTTMPSSSNAGSIVYITNPGASETVDPKSSGNAYYDDEFCHEWFTALSSNYVAPNTGTACGSTNAPPNGAVAAYVSSISPYTGTSSSLKYKWVRVTLKQNQTFQTAPVDGGTPSSQTCWDSTNSREVSASVLGYADCPTAMAAGLNVGPVYIVTALAITPQGSRRIGQYETAAVNLTPPPGALALDGPAATFNPRPSSTNYFASGYNSANSSNASYTPWNGPGTCSTNLPQIVPAVGVGDATGVTTIDAQLTSNPDRSGNYTGTGGTPSVVNEGSTGSNLLGGLWSSPAQLNTLAANLGNGADVTYTCAIGTPCNGSGPYGTNSNPQITFVNGDFNFGSSSGAGVLVVTGTLNITGNSSFNGLILVIGQGVLSESGGGNGQFNGSIFLAQTNASISPYATLATLGTPQIQWNGGGTNGIQYNSCWANVLNNLHYSVVASREEMY